jgi:Icc protein
LDISFYKEHQDSVKLLQITDTHLFASDEGALLGVNTADSLNAVVQTILSRRVDYQLILATGDISQDHSDYSYQRFVEAIRPLEKTCLCIPGNHDDKPAMGSVLPGPQIIQPRHVMIGAFWQIILLDSQVVGAPHGLISDDQLTFLDQTLSTYDPKHTLVLLHHHPLLVGSGWLDQHALKNSDAFWDVMLRYSHVKGALCGHVHQVMDRDYHGVLVMSTPSTCVQFKPQSDEFALDLAPPGWRELTLHPDGRLVTNVERLNHGLFLPDFSAHGY